MNTRRLKMLAARSLSTLLLALALRAPARAADAFPTDSKLRFKEDHTFKIVAFGDAHWAGKTPEDLRTLTAMETILDTEKPDFVMYTGDNCLSHTVPDVREDYRQMTAPVVRRGIPWAATLGNHDGEKGAVTRQGVFECMLDLPGNLSRPGPKHIHGYSNFILPVLGRQTRKPAALLYVLDSNAYFKQDGLDTYDWVRHDQVQWYRQASEFYRAKNRGTILPSYLFLHIPIPQYDLFYTNQSRVGVKLESVCSSAIDGGLGGAILEHRDIKAVFCGHDHVNDYITGFNGLWLGYVRGISYHTYGKEGFLKGSRVILLKEGTAAFDTWLRLEDGQKINVVRCE